MNFELVLLVATLVAGLIWGYDLIVFAKARKLRIAAAKVEADAPLSKATLANLEHESFVIDQGRSLFPVLVFIFILRSFIVEPFQIPSGSMLPNLKAGDFIIVNKYEYGVRLPVSWQKIFTLGTPKKGDVMVFRYPQNPNIYYIKRVLGVSGDSIEYRNKQLYINGQLQEQKLVWKRPNQLLLTEQLEQKKYRIQQNPSRKNSDFAWEVPEGHYFVLGDNRDASHDSRYWGFVPEELVVGRAFAVWLHWPEFLSWPSFGSARFID